jgi:hypothetical protein
MRVKTLIKHLQSLDQESEVVIDVYTKDLDALELMPLHISLATGNMTLIEYPVEE